MDSPRSASSSPSQSPSPYNSNDNDNNVRNRSRNNSRSTDSRSTDSRSTDYQDSFLSGNDLHRSLRLGSSHFESARTSQNPNRHDSIFGQTQKSSFRAELEHGSIDISRNRMVESYNPVIGQATSQDLLHHGNIAYLETSRALQASRDELMSIRIKYVDLRDDFASNKMKYADLYEKYTKLSEDHKASSMTIPLSSPQLPHSIPTVNQFITPPVPTPNQAYQKKHFWTRAMYNDRPKTENPTALNQVKGKKGPTKIKNNRNQHYIVYEGGMPVSGDRVAAMLKFVRSLLHDLASREDLPESWGRATFTARNWVFTNMEAKFPELRLCEDNWKTDLLISRMYSYWSKCQRTRVDGMKVESEDDILAMMEEDEEEDGDGGKKRKVSDTPEGSIKRARIADSRSAKSKGKKRAISPVSIAPSSIALSSGSSLEAPSSASTPASSSGPSSPNLSSASTLAPFSVSSPGLSSASTLASSSGSSSSGSSSSSVSSPDLSSASTFASSSGSSSVSSPDLPSASTLAPSSGSLSPDPLSAASSSGPSSLNLSSASTLASSAASSSSSIASPTAESITSSKSTPVDLDDDSLITLNLVDPLAEIFGAPSEPSGRMESIQKFINIDIEKEKKATARALKSEKPTKVTYKKATKSATCKNLYFIDWQSKNPSIKITAADFDTVYKALDDSVLKPFKQRETAAKNAAKQALLSIDGATDM